MSDFVKYQHVERLGTADGELDGLLEGRVQVFPKIDGANHCVYFDRDLGRVAYASRNQLLSEGYDSTGFWHFADAHGGLAEHVSEHPHRIYGEYLTPHTVRGYEDSAWNRFYVFDIWDDGSGAWLPYEEVARIVEGIGDPDVVSVPCIADLADPAPEDLERALESDTFLLRKGEKGEGIVIKNYGYRNRFGRQTWGKIVREEFSDMAKAKNKGQRELLPEEKAVEATVTEAFVSKEFHKFTTDRGVAWEDSMTGEFLKTVFAEWWKDCSYDTLSRIGTVDMKAVRKTVSKCAMRQLGRLWRLDGTTGRERRWVRRTYWPSSAPAVR